MIETIIYKIDKKGYSVIGFKFDHSAESLPVEGLLIDGKPCSHAKYFQKRKNIHLEYPNARPMVEVLGRRKAKYISSGRTHLRYVLIFLLFVFVRVSRVCWLLTFLPCRPVLSSSPY